MKKAFLLLIAIGQFLLGHAQQNDLRLVLPIGHTDRVNSAVFSPDGKSIVTASYDNTAKIWDAQSGWLLHSLEGHTDRVNFAVFSPDGKTIVTASGDKTAKIWDAQCGRLLHSLEGHTSWVESAAFSPDGKSIVTASWDDKTPIIWDAQSGLLLRTLKGHTYSVKSAVFSPDGKSIVTASYDNTAKIWDAQSGLLLHSLEGHTYSVKSAVFSPDGKSIVTTSEDKTAIIWDAQSGLLLHSLEGHTSFVESAVFSPDGKSIVTASWDDKTPKIWDAQSGLLLRTLKGHTYSVKSAAFSPDGKSIVTASWDDKTPKIWDAQSGLLLHSLEEHTGSVRSAVFSPDGKSIVSASWDNTAKIWDAQSGLLLRTLGGHTNRVNSVAFNPDGKSIVTASTDATAKIWDAQSGLQLRTLKGHTDWLISAVFSPDGKTIVTATGDKTAKIWDAQSGLLLRTLKGHLHWIRSAVFSPDGKTIVTASRDKTAKIWDVQSGLLLRTLKGHTSWVNSAVFSPDGKTIVTASADKTAKIWDAQKGRLLRTLKGHTRWVNSAAFSPDGKSIVTASGDKTAKIWDAQKGRLHRTLGGHTDWLISAAFSPDGKTIVTATGDKTAKIWDAQGGKLLRDFHINGILSAIDFDNDRFISHNNSMLTLHHLETAEVIYSWVYVNENDYLVMHPDGYYDGTEAARELLYFVCDNEIIDLAQLKDALYVPGLIEKIMNGEEINYPKLSDLDICHTLPLIEKIENTGHAYQYKITPRKLGLEQVEVYINNKKVFSTPKKELHKQGEEYFLDLKEEEISKHLLAGTENRINVIGTVLTKEGNELKSRGVGVIRIANKKDENRVTPRLFAVMIGVNDYKDPSLKLNYPVKDVEDLSKALEISTTKLLGKENVFMYLIHSGVKSGKGYSTPEKEGIRKALEDIGKKARPEDIILMFFAGHGVMQGSDEKRFTFLTAEASNLNLTGINTKELQDWLSFEGPHKILANKSILIFDACNSGQATQELVALARNDDQTRRIRQVEDLKDKSGMFILAASAPNQAAYELPQYEQGLLTYSLLSMLKSNPEILDGQFLNVQKWFLESEKFLKKLVESHGYKQDAQPFGSANIRIGLVDEEVTNQIVLAKEKPVVICANVLNAETLSDGLMLKDLLNKELLNISERGMNSSIIFARQETPSANKINIGYQMNGEKIVCQIRLLKGSEQLHQASLTGSKNDMQALVRKIIEEVVKYAK